MSESSESPKPAPDSNNPLRGYLEQKHRIKYAQATGHHSPPKGYITELAETEYTDKSELQQKNQELENAGYEGLFLPEKILNRRAMETALPILLERARRNKKTRSVAAYMLDGDRFKRVNDEFNHLVGDDVLRTIGIATKRTFHRGGDMVARYGGEEILIVAEGLTKEQAVAMGWQLQENYSQVQEDSKNPQTQLANEQDIPKGKLPQNLPPQTLSIGITHLTADDPRWDDPNLARRVTQDADVAEKAAKTVRNTLAFNDGKEIRVLSRASVKK